MKREEFEAAVVRYQDTVFRVALHALGSRAEGEDAVQEVFLRLFTCETSFESEEHLRRWLIRVTVNTCKNVLKSRWRRRVPLDAAGEPFVFAAPEEQKLYEAVLSLPEKYRTVLDLFYYEDLPTLEIAEILGLRQTAVTTRLSRARMLLKKKLEEEERHE